MVTVNPITLIWIVITTVSPMPLKPVESMQTVMA